MSAADLLRRAGNEALKSNPTVADIDITTHASDFLWAVFSVMAFTTLAVGVWASFVPRGNRAFFHVSMMITGTASVAYFCMASDLGATPIAVEFGRGSGGDSPLTRSIWYARYVDWTITTPLLLLELLLVTGLPLSDIVVTIFADLVMIITGLIGSLVASQYKWGLFAIGNFAMFYVFYQLYFPGRIASKSLGPELSKTYLVGAGILSFLWFLYPVAWGLADGSNTITPTSEMIFYGILDLLAKPVFAFIHLYSLRNIDYQTLQLSSGKYSEFEGNGEVPVSSHSQKKLGHTTAAEPVATSGMVERTSPNGNGESTLHGH
ncbi:hypothetical protein CBS101457_004654 [Exobasidium rhododendri]|nr:hypothetical protein CBS101457_004654 [Exobasidium rhododendri]